MPDRWRNKATRDLVALVRAAGGDVERGSKGKIKITGPAESVTIHEPGGETRRDLRNSAATVLIAKRTGLDFTKGSN